MKKKPKLISKKSPNPMGSSSPSKYSVETKNIYPCKAGVRCDRPLAPDPVHHVEVAHLVLRCSSNVGCPK